MRGPGRSCRRPGRSHPPPAPVLAPRTLHPIRVTSMTNLAFLPVALGLMGFGPAGAGSGAAEPRKRPNVIILLTDDNGYGDLSCHGNPVLRTPNFDLLHDQSVRLPTFTSPRCVRQREASS